MKLVYLRYQFLTLVSFSEQPKPVKLVEKGIKLPKNRKMPASTPKIKVIKGKENTAICVENETLCYVHTVPVYQYPSVWPLPTKSQPIL